MPTVSGYQPDEVCTESPPSSSLYSTITCSSTNGTTQGKFLGSLVPRYLESSPYVAVESYHAGQGCAVTELSVITVYIADGECHRTDATNSYMASRNLDGAAVIQLYMDNTCDIVGDSLIVTAAQATENSCAGDDSGVLDKKIYGSEQSPPNLTWYLSTTMVYETNIGDCQMSAVPSTVVATIFDGEQCTATTACTTTKAPSRFLRTACGTSLTYNTEMAAAFGSHPYVMMAIYQLGKNCAATALSGIVTYLANGRCHKGVSDSFKALIFSDGSVYLRLFKPSDCTGTDKILDMTAAQVAGNSCANDANGALDVKVYLSEQRK